MYIRIFILSSVICKHVYRIYVNVFVHASVCIRCMQGCVCILRYEGGTEICVQTLCIGKS